MNTTLTVGAKVVRIGSQAHLSNGVVEIEDFVDRTDREEVGGPRGLAAYLSDGTWAYVKDLELAQ